MLNKKLEQATDSANKIQGRPEDQNDVALVQNVMSVA